jgi:CBS domain-containing protein
MTTIATISVRDFLPLIVKPERQINNFNDCGNSQQERTIPLSEISSKLVSVSKYDSLRDTIDLMIQRSTRNIGIRDENSSLVGIFNDRSILEFLFTHKDFVMRALHDKRDDHTKDESNNNGTNGNPVRLGRYNINNRYYTNENNNSDIPGSINSIMSDLHIIPLSKVKVTKTTTLSRAAELLTDLRTPCLILEEDSIVTPWDVIIKTADLSN